MAPLPSPVLKKACRSDASIDEHEHVRPNLRKHLVGSMHFRDIIAIHREATQGMAATLTQEHAAHLRIGPFALVITAATKGLLVGLCVSGVEDRAVNGHKPRASKEGARHLLRWGKGRTSLAQEGLQALAA
jgi:hypothetical protein